MVPVSGGDGDSPYRYLEGTLPATATATAAATTVVLLLLLLVLTMVPVALVLVADADVDADADADAAYWNVGSGTCRCIGRNEMRRKQSRSGGAR
jgi:hypothetical protein